MLMETKTSQIHKQRDPMTRTQWSHHHGEQVFRSNTHENQYNRKKVILTTQLRKYYQDLHPTFQLRRIKINGPELQKQSELHKLRLVGWIHCRILRELWFDILQTHWLTPFFTQIWQFLNSSMGHTF